MLSNPYLTVPYKEAAWSEGFCKGLAAVASPGPSDEVSAEDYDAFNEGVATGADAAANGIAIDYPCIPALEPSPGHGVGMAIDGLHLLHAGWELAALKLAAGFAGLLVVVVTLGASANAALPAEQVLPQLGVDLTSKLQSFGAGSLEFFCGVRLDLLSHDCTMLMSSFFLTQWQAEEAAAASAGNDGWLVVSWRTDQSNSFRIVSTNGG